MVYGATPDQAVVAVKALALQVLADRLRHGESAQLATIGFDGRRARA